LRIYLAIQFAHALPHHFFVLYRAFVQDRIVLQTGVLFDGKGAVLKKRGS
jgi:hypothetical protein